MFFLSCNIVMDIDEIMRSGPRGGVLLVDNRTWLT